MLPEKAHAEHEHLAGETSPWLIGADGQLRVPVAVERALVDVGAARDDVGVVDDLQGGPERVCFRVVLIPQHQES